LKPLIQEIEQHEELKIETHEQEIEYLKNMTIEHMTAMPPPPASQPPRQLENQKMKIEN